MRSSQSERCAHRSTGKENDSVSFIPTLSVQSNTDLSNATFTTSTKSAGPKVNSDRCCLCLEIYDGFDKKEALLCEHEFHKVCIKKWLLQNGTCPLCRRHIRRIKPEVNTFEDIIERRIAFLQMQADQLRQRGELLSNRATRIFRGIDTNESRKRQGRHRYNIAGTRLRHKNRSRKQLQIHLCNKSCTAMRPFLLVTHIAVLIMLVWIFLSIFNINPVPHGKFEIETTYSDSSRIGAYHLKKYRGAILNYDFRKMKIFEIWIKSKSMWNNPYYKDFEYLVFQIGLVNKRNVDKEIDSVSDGIIVSAKSCERNRLCVIVERETNILFHQIVDSFTFKESLSCFLSFELKSRILNMYYLSKEHIRISLVRLYVKGLERYSLVAGLGYSLFAHSVMTFLGNLRVSPQVNPEMHISSNGKTLGNTEYLRSSVDIAIPDKIKSTFYILEYEANVYLQNYNNIEEKDLFEVGLAPMDLVLHNKKLRTAKNTTFIHVTLEYSKPRERKFHIYTWADGHVRIHLSLAQNSSNVAEKYAKFMFKFEINNDCTNFLLSMYNEHDLKYDYIDIFDKVESTNTFYPSVGKRISLFSTQIFYSLRKSNYLNFFT